MEAHASDGFWPNEAHSIKAHTALEDRLESAKTLDDIGISGRLLVDSMEDLACHMYGAVPERLFILKGGVVTYVGALGPIGYDLDEMEEKLKTLF
ncbi:type I iodothyronine deiodinase-like [Aplysia californica]|uniref:Iodothyronine deiodinase n=1 Tax=Aplysia californica TaxID=6500 RepID=A0ABM1VVN1_APLCA|nr:type I iodothyronine deiodinase-like [Aplysia californica]